MTAHSAKLLIKGIVGGSLVGFVLGFYAWVTVKDYVLSPVEFEHPRIQEIVEVRFRTAMLCSFVVCFASIGPFIAGAEFGPWIRHAAYGMTTVTLLIALAAIIADRISHPEFASQGKGWSHSIYLDFAHNFAVPIGFFAGTTIGILFGKWKWPEQSSAQSSPSATNMIATAAFRMC